MFDIIRFCDDYSVDYKSNGDWLLINCPIVGCKCRDYKGGFNVSNSYYNCFRCGWHSVLEFIQAITGFDWGQVYVIQKEYTTGTVKYNHSDKNNFKPVKVDLPLFCKPIRENKKACEYLEKRGFDIYFLEDNYGVLATNHLSNVPHRIIIPIFFKGQLVSWTARSYLKNIDKGKRYFSCAKEKEVVPHKSILYNWDNTSDTIIIVEGPTDVFRIGTSTVCTFGTQFCDSQISLIKEKKKCYIAFDREPIAQQKAKKLMNSINMFTEVENILIPYKDKYGEYKDPGSFSQKEVKEFRDFCGI
jgi:DNA primase